MIVRGICRVIEYQSQIIGRKTDIKQGAYLYAAQIPIQPSTAIGAHAYGAGVLQSTLLPKMAKPTPSNANAVVKRVAMIARFKWALFRLANINIEAITATERVPTCQEK